jgi:hypothetical protein
MIRLTDFNPAEVRRTLEASTHHELVRFLKLLDARTLLLERMKVDGIGFLELEDATLDVLGLPEDIAALVRRFQQERWEEFQAREAERLRQLAEEEAERREEEEEARLEMLRAKGVEAVPKTAEERQLESDRFARSIGLIAVDDAAALPEKPPRVSYAVLREKIAQRSEKGVETRLMEERLQRMYGDQLTN